MSLACLQRVIPGIIGLFGGTAGDDLAKTISRCLDTGRELLPKGFASLEDLEEKSSPGFCFF